MSITVRQNLAKFARRALLASLLCQSSTTMAEVIDIPVAPIDRVGSARTGSMVRQAQGQVPATPRVTPPNRGTRAPAIQPPIREFPDANVLQEEVIAPPAVAPVPAPDDTVAPPGDAPPLNVDPNADIADLIPPTPPATSAPVPRTLPTSQRAAIGAMAGAFSAAPTMIGDLFGGGLSTFGGTQTIPFGGYSAGTILLGSSTQDNSLIVFEFGGDLVPDDVFTTGTGSDLAGADGFIDSYSITEPIPPSDAPTSPGPGFVFDGGTAVFVGNNPTATTPQAGDYVSGDQWYVAYSYSQTLLGPEEGGRPVPTPGVSVRRIKLSENFSPEVRNRCFASYNFFNDAYGGLGDVSRYTLGFERILVDKLVSMEARLLMAGTYGSTQILENTASRDFEIGNAAFIGKGVLLRTSDVLWSAGLGFTIPTADDTRIQRGGQNILVIKNRTVHLLPFTALLLRLTQDTYFQTYMQLDVAANGDPLYGNLAGGPLPKLGVFTDSTLMNLDFALNHVLHRSRSRGSLVRQVIGNAELHYSGSLQESDFVTADGLTYTNLKRYFNVLNATAGFHLVLGDHLVVTPAMSVPLRDGLDEQFDYEAIVQVNYLH